ncbi:MAG: Manganese/iron superoxide dismutase [Berkelbacteria bacterium GW2011_GWA2_46_7]|uniref:superoxide dismutase n=1 Tax=Berkelbacteria bacterium GW2011_GWA2_46_7 TaxID=1618335 RepID=A0A0G1QF11_9BACT|nr:MAG: Manganese/iron superoxide dismutase [Berkelbacteria bacterium GW2011_GWA2_46_7]
MYEAKKFDSIRKLNGISELTMTEHYKLYESYVKKFNEIDEKLREVDLDSANPTFSDVRSLKVELSFALSGIKNHEIYFGHLGGDGGKPSGKLLDQIKKDFGSFEGWQKDLKATGMGARGWAWLAWDHDLRRLFNLIGDTQNTYLVWNCTPLVALDVYEHAYYLDFATKRADYIDTFSKNLDWPTMEKNFVNLELD